MIEHKLINVRWVASETTQSPLRTHPILTATPKPASRPGGLLYNILYYDIPS